MYCISNYVKDSVVLIYNHATSLLKIFRFTLAGEQ